MSKEIKISQQILNEVKLIVAIANAKSINSFFEDLFTHWVQRAQTGNVVADLRPIIKQTQENTVKMGLRIDSGVMYDLRILAAETDGTSLKAYMEAIVIWLANEHRDKGRVWIDDTPAKALPIRMRK